VADTKVSVLGTISYNTQIIGGALIRANKFTNSIRHEEKVL